MTRWGAGLSVLIVVLGTAVTVSAQERAGRVYVTAGGAVVHEDGLTGEQPVVYETAPGGSTIGWFAGGGVFLARWISIEAELSRTGTMRAREPSRYDMIFADERRDLFVIGAVRFHLPVERHVDVEPVVGAGIVRTTDTSTVEYAAGSVRAGTTPYTTTATIDPRRALALGADLRAGNGRVQFVPSFRVLFTAEYPSWPTYYPGGAPDRAVRAGVAIRVLF